MNDENEYMKLGWDNNVKNCNVPIDRSVMICDDPYSGGYEILQAGIIIGELGLKLDGSIGVGMHSCGKWHWMEFKDSADAMAFKLRW